MKYTILVVEDDLLIHESIVKYLEQSGYSVMSANDGEQACRIFCESEVHLILLDIMLPKLDGIEVLKYIRKRSTVPIVMISALNDEISQAQAFLKEADDYVIKPFSMKILLYKINALLKRIYQKSEILKWNDVEVYTNNYKVTNNGEVINLTATEFELLQLFLQNKNIVLSREQIISALWNEDYEGYSRSIDVHVKNIRKKIDKNLIETVNRIGYVVKE